MLKENISKTFQGHPSGPSMTTVNTTDFIYDNVEVLSPDGEFMFRCNSKRARWYLKRQLAEVISRNPPQLKLLFDPCGPGHSGDPFHCQERGNYCSVCGKTGGLSRHHIVPYCYRKSLVQVIACYKYDIHDILPLCGPCHEKYEIKFASQLRQQLAQEYDVPLAGTGLVTVWRDELRAIRAAAALDKYEHQIPEPRKAELKEMISSFLGKPATRENWQVLRGRKADPRGPDYRTHGETLVAKLTDPEKFVRRWRNHFIESMKPQHMPDHWEITRSLEAVESSRRAGTS